jgi:hypothetical protein
VIHAFGILCPVESSLKLRSNVQLTFLQAYVSPEPRAITKSARSAATVMLELSKLAS